MSATDVMPPFEPGESFARSQDLHDPLAAFRERFCLPRARGGGGPAIYFCGNSLGLQPRAAREIVNEELDDWAGLAVEGHFAGRRPWYSYHELLREPGARLVGALPHEIVFMNSLTVNLHLLMQTFYRPTAQRHAILIEDCAFPSDIYAVQTQIAMHGFDPQTSLLIARPRDGEAVLRTEDILARLERDGARIALVMMSAVNYFSGQFFDVAEITAAARQQGCVAGWDLAHAAGNVPLALHEWNVDFAAWCTYKYLNSGPGAVAGAFVHERHARNTSLPRLGGWWGNDPHTRFRMHLQPQFVPVPSADAWQLSNPPILALAPVLASLRIFDEATMPALRAKSLRLTSYLRWLIERNPTERYTIITPAGAAAHGCQLSILAHRHPRELHEQLTRSGVMCDFRQPDVIRVAPVPLYNTFHEVWRFAEILRQHE